MELIEAAAAKSGRLLGQLLNLFFDDLLLLAGCGCILRGLALWNPVVTWVTAGVMLIGFGFLIGKARARHATH